MRDTIKYVHWSAACTVPHSYACPVLIKFELLGKFSKNSQVSNFMKIRLVGAELCHADRHRDMTKLIVAFRNFANAPKNQSVNDV